MGKSNDYKVDFAIALLSALLNEMDLLDGQWSGTKEAVAYCSQTPWLQDASIRDNILFSSPFQENRYLKVLSDCELQQDMENLKDADLSLLGEKYNRSSGSLFMTSANWLSVE
jgi:ABC-type transport system involved in cytochrome bd biosynthesis fused ATPase/permease subunit